MPDEEDGVTPKKARTLAWFFTGLFMTGYLVGTIVLLFGSTPHDAVVPFMLGLFATFASIFIISKYPH